MALFDASQWTRGKLSVSRETIDIIGMTALRIAEALPAEPTWEDVGRARAQLRTLRLQRSNARADAHDKSAWPEISRDLDLALWALGLAHHLSKRGATARNR